MNRYRFIDEGRKHLHILDEKPLIGVTTAKSIIGGKDNLMQWYADVAAVAALAFPAQDIKGEYEAVQKIRDKVERANAKRELDKKYPNYAIARRAALESRDKSADEGTMRHGALEAWIKECLKNGGTPDATIPHDNSIKVFVKWSEENVDRFLFTEANCYHEWLWLGGIADLGLKMKDGKNLIGDHKNGKEAYPDQFLQCSLYDLLLSHSGLLDKDGNKTGEWAGADGYVIFPFRSEPFTPEFKWDVDLWRKNAVSVVELYKLLELNN